MSEQSKASGAWTAEQEAAFRAAVDEAQINVDNEGYAYNDHAPIAMAYPAAEQGWHPDFDESHPITEKKDD